MATVSIRMEYKSHEVHVQGEDCDIKIAVERALHAVDRSVNHVPKADEKKAQPST